MSDEPSDWAFARTPKWIAGHALALVLVTMFVLAGLWQWSRHREVGDRNDRIEARQEQPAIGTGDLAAAQPDDVAFRNAEVSGEWDPVGQVAIRNRSLGGASGCHVVTPLLLDDGTALLVTRGWVPLADCDDDGVTAHPPPPGSHTVTGLVRSSQARGSFGPRDAAEGELKTLHRVDVARIDAQYEPALLDLYLELAAVDPAAAEPAEPVPVPPPSLDAGPHLGYTVQWFLFAVVGLVGYPIVLRRQVRPRPAGPAVRPPKPAPSPPRRPSDPRAGRAPPASSRSST